MSARPHRTTTATTTTIGAKHFCLDARASIYCTQRTRVNVLDDLSPAVLWPRVSERFALLSVRRVHCRAHLTQTTTPGPFHRARRRRNPWAGELPCRSWLGWSPYFCRYYPFRFVRQVSFQFVSQARIHESKRFGLFAIFARFPGVRNTIVRRFTISFLTTIF